MTSAPSKRRSERLEHELLVAYRTVDGFITDWATNISKGGVFINSRAPLPVGTTVRLIVSLPDTAFPFDLTGKVTRVVDHATAGSEAPGMGLEFMDVDEDKRARIERFVDKLRDELSVDMSKPKKG